MPVLAGYIAMSIADRPGLAVGFVGGIIASAGYTFGNLMNYDAKTAISAGFLGALLAGFVGGYLVCFRRNKTSFIIPCVWNTFNWINNDKCKSNCRVCKYST